MKQIKFNGKIHSFPDDATEEEINQTLGGDSQEPSLLNKISSEAEGALHMPLGRSLKNIGQGTVDFAELLANPAGPAMKYIASKDIPYVSAGAKHWPQFPESDVFGLGEKQPGDTLFQAVTPLGPAAKGAQFAGKSLEQLVKMAVPTARKAATATAKAADKTGDLLPLLKSTASKPYKKQMQILTEKGLLEGYKPNIPDVMEAARVLTSKGMKIPHEAVNEAVEQTLKGNFKPWFNLQSTVRKEARRLSSMGGVNNTLGEKLHALAEKMHTDIGMAQAERGAPEAERLMHQGKARTARHHKISPKSKIAGGIAAASMTPRWIGQMIKALSK